MILQVFTMGYLLHIVVRKFCSFPLWLKRKMCAYALHNQQNALNQTVDITKVPPARGKLRLLQNADTLLLQIFDDFCERNGFKYYLAYGTLLGAVRHGGFIPWDDDIDLMVFADDFEKIRNQLEKEISGTGFTLYGVDSARYEDLTFRLSHRDFPAVNIDLFLTFPSALPKMKLEELRMVLQKMANRQMKISRRLAFGRLTRSVVSDYWRNFIEVYRNIVSSAALDEAKSFYGIGCVDSNCYARDELMPLTRIPFEGVLLPAPSCPEAYLDETIPDWMSFPHRFDHHGEQFLSFTTEEAKRIIELFQQCVTERRFI